MSDPLHASPPTCAQTLRALARYPGRTAFSWPGGSLTYQGATDLIGRIQGVFMRLGLQPGDTAIEGGIEEQTERIFANLGAILAEVGSGLDRLVKTTVFLQNLGDFQAMNSVYAQHVGDNPPARSTVEVAKLPSGALVEIEAVALL